MQEYYLIIANDNVSFDIECNKIAKQGYKPLFPPQYASEGKTNYVLTQQWVRDIK